MSTNKQTTDECENEIQDLKNQVKRLESSKIELMVNTTKEIDRLREYIKCITTKKSSIGIGSLHGILADSTASNISNEVKDNVDASSSSDIRARVSRSRPGTDIGDDEEKEEMRTFLEINHDIIEEMETVLNEFMTLKLFGVVECKCNQAKQLQFIASMAMDEPDMKCNNCHQLYCSMFKCDSCHMSICSTCQKYIAERQCLRSVMQHFKYPKQFKQEINTNNLRKMSQYDYERYEYDDYNQVNQHDYDDVFLVENQGGNQFHGELMKLLTQLQFKASDKLEYIFEEDLFKIMGVKIDHQMCYEILNYLDDVDLCYILANSKSSVQLLEIYWQLFDYHLTYDIQYRQWKKLRLLFSSHWELEDKTLITIKQRITNNSAAKEYINDYYIPTINGNQLIKPKLFGYDEVDGRIITCTETNSIYHNYYINKQLNEGFGNKVIRLLRIIIDNEEYNNSQITFERLKHKKYGKDNEILANGIYYIWHCHGLQRSFALEEQSFSTYQDAMADEDDIDDNIDDNNVQTQQQNGFINNQRMRPNVNNNGTTNNNNNNDDRCQPRQTKNDAMAPLTPMFGAGSSFDYANDHEINLQTDNYNNPSPPASSSKSDPKATHTKFTFDYDKI